MSTSQTEQRVSHRGASKSDEQRGPVSRGFSWVPLIVALSALGALCLGWRIYQQVWAFSTGLDSHGPDFNKYWLTLAAANMLLLPTAAAAIFAWTWVSAKRLPKELTREDEGRRLWTLWVLVAMFCATVFAGGSYFAEEDATWHQILTRDTAFTPSHDVLFYGVFPLMIYMAAGIYLYARTRLPHIYGGKALPVSFTLIVAGSALLFFQVAMNEFGHSFFQAEEVFSAPLHWPFVIFGYLLAATFAIWFETLPRIFELARQERELAAAATSSDKQAHVATAAAEPATAQRESGVLH